MSLVKRINLLCDEHDTTFAEVERKCGLSNGSIRRWDTNTPSTDKLQKVADYFDVSTDYLLGRTNTKNPANAKLAEQEKYIESIKLDTAEDAMKFILQQPSLMAFGGYDLNEMTEEELLDLANDMLFAMKLSLEKNKRK